MALIVLFVVLGLAPMVAAQPWQICGSSNYTANSLYQSNLDTLSSSLVTEGSDPSGLFAKGSTGDAPNKVYAVALCRGDVNASTCAACVDAAFKAGATRLCPRSKDATIFYDDCLLRFSDQDILNMDSSSRVNTLAVVDGALVLMNISSEPMLPGWDDWNADNQAVAKNVTHLFFKTTLANTVAQVLKTTSHYAAIRMDMDGVSTSAAATVRRLYCLAQCAPDLVEDICYNCLNNFSDLATANFAGKQGGRVLGLRCNLRYDTSKFYAGEPTWSSGSSDAVALPQVQHCSPASSLHCHITRFSKGMFGLLPWLFH